MARVPSHYLFFHCYKHWASPLPIYLDGDLSSTLPRFTPVPDKHWTANSTVPSPYPHVQHQPWLPSGFCVSRSSLHSRPRWRQCKLIPHKFPCVLGTVLWTPKALQKVICKSFLSSARRRCPCDPLGAVTHWKDDTCTPGHHRQALESV